MTDLRLVCDNGEPTIPVSLSDVATAARGFADAVEAGKINASRVIVITVVDGKLDFTCFGDSPTIAEGIGYLELAKARVIEGAWQSD